METEEYIVFMVVGAIVINATVLPVLIQIKQDTIAVYLKGSTFLYSLFNNFILNPIILTLSITLMTELLIYIIYNEIYIRTKKGKKREFETREELCRIKEFLGINIKSSTYRELLINYLEFQNPRFLYVSLSKYQKDIDKKLDKMDDKITELEQEQREELRDIKLKRDEAEEELEEINHEIYIKKAREEEKRKNTIERLNIGYKEVFKRENLSPREREIVKEEGYSAINEYCVLENKLISVLVKPPLNHSPTHAFLVWSVKRLLKKFSKIEGIIEHETRGADITFKIKNKTYAIEIEKGSLIGKKIQLREKIESLEDAYGDRWLILVSNKSLVKKYKEFGNVSTRKNLRNKIEKWVKNAENN